MRREEAAPVEGRQAVGKERLCKVREKGAVITQSICHLPEMHRVDEDPQGNEESELISNICTRDSESNKD